VPIYEYQCQACGDVSEVMQKFDAAPPDECEKCHKGPLAKLLSKTAFVLKGNGWYVTDFRGGNGGKSTADSSSGASSGASSSESTSTSTPAAASAKTSE
jgi:putative FmdB family regulatory protein